MIHNVDNIQPETLNLRIHCTIVTGTLLIYNKDAIKKKCNFFGVLLSRSRALSHF